MDNILFVGGFFPEQIRNEIIKNSKSSIQFAADTLQRSFIRGLKSFFPEMSILNFPFVGSFPIRYKKIFLPQCAFDEDKGLSVKFVNLIGIKQFVLYYKIKSQVEKWYDMNDGRKIIILYSIQYSYLKALTDIKHKRKGIEIFLIVPDLVQYKINPNGILYYLKREFEINQLKKCYKQVDAYILLSKYMKDSLPIENKPWCVIEGIFEEMNQPILIEKDKNKVIMYSGTLARRYGIMNLVSAFLQIKNHSYRLWICGAGESGKEIEELAKINDRIVYFGWKLDQIDVITLQKKATVLVNPCTSEGDFTKYSFPSKTMEYLASGTPTILHRLPGIPEEYYKYVIVPDKEDVLSLKDAIMKGCEMDKEEREKFGNAAKAFIIEKKNPYVQVKKILDLINAI